MRPKKKKREGRPLSAATKGLWKAIRHARRFTYADLSEVTGLNERQIEVTTRPWRYTGIVRVFNDGFRLARELGPLPPYRLGNGKGLASRVDGEVLPFLEELMPKKLPPGEARRRYLARIRRARARRKAEGRS